MQGTLVCLGRIAVSFVLAWTRSSWVRPREAQDTMHNCKLKLEASKESSKPGRRNHKDHLGEIDKGKWQESHNAGQMHPSK